MDVHHDPGRLEVGVRDLRAELRRWLEAAASGAEVVVTERGRPVARIVPIEPAEGALERLHREGLLSLPARQRPRAADLSRVRASGAVSDLVAEQRR
jgi:prevent-host-death family protein